MVIVLRKKEKEQGGVGEWRWRGRLQYKMDDQGRTC